MTIKKIHFFTLTMLTGLIFLCSGCNKKEDVSLTIWVQEEEYSMVTEAVEQFKKENKNTAKLDINIHNESFSTVKNVILSNPKAAADVYVFTDDQFLDLKNSNVLLPVTVDKDEVIANCGGQDTLIIDTIYKDEHLYGYPSTASNGYFLYYNKDYYTEEDVQQLDTILDIAADNNKYFVMDWTSGWYLYSFFGGAGKIITADTSTGKNLCDFNSTTGPYSGLDITNAMLDIANHPGFSTVADSNLVNSVANGDVIAMVSGTWYANTFQDILGDKLGACKLPTYTVHDTQVQMASFAGFKYYGINPNTSYPEWSQKLASYLTNYDNQLARFEAAGECPSNVKASETDAVQQSVAIGALKKQLPYATVQNVYETYWDPMAAFGCYIASGNPDNKDLQELLDETVEQITK